MSQQWLWAAVPFAVVGLAILSLTIWKLVATHRGGLVLHLPLIAEQELVLEAVGPMLLHGEGPRFTTAFADLDFRLIDLSDGAAVPLSGVVFKASSSGLSTARLSLRAFEVTRPGRYRLTALGLSSPPPGAPHALLIGHDRRGRTVAIILALVLAAIAAVAGLVLSALIVVLNR